MPNAIPAPIPASAQSKPGSAATAIGAGVVFGCEYDGERFWGALRRAVEVSGDPREQAEIYAELALETTKRPGIWLKSPPPGQV